MRNRERVERLSRCSFFATPRGWDFAESHAESIDRNWADRTRANPSLFNGVVYVMDALRIEAGVCSGTFQRTDFKSYVFWRDRGYPEAGVRHAFGSGLLLSAEGHVILGVQRAGTLHAGQAYMPGGFIDHRDVAPDGRIDVAASVARELAEETGLTPGELTREPGCLVTFAGSLVSVAITMRSRLRSQALRERILAHIAHETEPELADAVIVRSTDDLAALVVPRYAQLTLSWLFAQSSALVKS